MRAEGWLRRAVLTQTRRRTWHWVPPTCVDLYEPFESVAVLRTTVDGNSTEAIAPGSVQGENGVVRAPSGGWGEGSLWTFDYVCGWAADDLPADIEQAVFQLAQTMYEQKTMPSDQIVAGALAVARTHQIVTVRVGDSGVSR